MNIGLKAALRLFVIPVIVLPAIIIAIAGSALVLSYSRSQIDEEVGSVAYGLGSGISVEMSNMIKTLELVSRLAPIREAAAGNYAAVSAELNRQISAYTDNISYLLDIVLTDPSGVVIADNLGRETGSIFSGFSEDIRALEPGKTHLSDVNTADELYGIQPTFCLSHAVTTGDETDILGYISMVMSTAAVYDYCHSVGNISAFGMDFFIADTRGVAVGFKDTPIARPDDLSPGLKTALTPILGKLTPPPPSAEKKYTLFDSGGLRGMYGLVTGTNWIWVAYSTESDNLSDTVSGLLIAILVTAVLMAIFVAGAIFITTWAIKPLKETIHTINVIAEGQRDARFKTGASNEYGQMGEQLNSLLDEVMFSEELHRTISELSDNMLFEWNFNKEELFLSDNFTEMFEIDKSTATLLNGRFLDALMSREDAEKFKREINRVIKELDSMTGEYQVRTKGGENIWISMRAQCVCDQKGEILRVIGVCTNVDNEKKLNLQLQSSASFDFLSQLYNRSTFERELQKELARTIDARLGVMFVDVDDFKFINDRYGHSVGDEIIKYVSKTIKDALAGGGFAGRFGGDEFVGCFTDKRLLNNIGKLGEQLIDIFAQGYHSEASDVHIAIKISIGIAFAPQHGREVITLIAAADEAMYFVKKNGKSNYHIYNPEDAKLLGPEA